ncbi:MAG TPA: tetratricopeptide repeat protein [Bryobacteraceae bacterium]|nr:tetratricopeptide repeat protein [Bryobacteraceae bacterium]
MRVWNLLFLSCVITAAAVAAEATFTVRSEIVDDLARAVALERNGNTRDAERLVLQIIARLASGGGSKIEMSIALNNLGILYIATDRYTDAERQFMRSIRILQTLDGDIPRQALAKTRLHLAALYLEMGREREIARLDVPKLIETLHGVEDQARAKGILAGLRAARRDFAAAEQMYAELLSFWMDPVRAAASQTEIAIVRNNLGVIALWQGRTDVARTRLEQSFEDWQRTGGPENPNLVKAMTNVASVYMQLKQYDHAEAWLARGAALGRKTLGEFHPFVVRIEFARAEALKKSGRKAEARELAQWAAEARGTVRSPSTDAYIVDYRDIQSLRPHSASRR